MSHGFEDPAFYGVGCRGKVGHRSRRIASGHLRVMKTRDYVLTPERLNVYKCKVCKTWHIGNNRG